MYRRPKFLEVLLEIRREMALEADYDVDLFAELARSGKTKRNQQTAQPPSIDTPDMNGKIAELIASRDK